MTTARRAVRPKKNANLETLVQGNTAFALALYQKLCPAEGNLFFSPYSISTALAMAYAGARGTTEAQMAQVLHFDLDQEPLHAAFAALESRLAEIEGEAHVRLLVANALWPHAGYSLLAPFVGLVLRSYGVEVTPVDYDDPETARDTINAWAEAKTEGKIRALIPPGILNALTRLVLTNAIYFKGNWATKFDPALTREAPFSVTPDRQVQVPMMHTTMECGCGTSGDVQVLQLPYAGDDLSMFVFLPSAADGLTDLEARLTEETLIKWTRAALSREVQVTLPRFEITTPFDLTAALRAMGMVDAFDADDFAGMVGSETLHIQAVLHKASVAVGEEGTVAAAATASATAMRSALLSPMTFRADHPFLFLIRERSTRTILFLGRVTDPAHDTGS